MAIHCAGETFATCPSDGAGVSTNLGLGGKVGGNRPDMSGKIAVFVAVLRPSEVNDRRYRLASHEFAGQCRSLGGVWPARKDD